MIGELRADSPRAIGPYRLLARLGAGGMGEVYLGADSRPSLSAGGKPQFAAVKTVRADAAGDPAFRARFRREITTARTVDSRFVSRLLAGDAEAAPPWLATEYVAGPTLDRAVRTAGPLAPEVVLGLGLDLARALRGIHHGRVLHRDLKPSNVLLGSDGPKVIDFGIARDFGASTMTGTGAMVGTPGFMSPEHVLGSRHVVAASDVFCLGAVLCFAATGEGPFGTGPLAAVLYRIVQAEADLGAVPVEVRELVADCLRRDPSARPDAAELESRLRAAGGVAQPGDWPAGVRTLITSYEDDLDRFVRAAGALARPVPTMPGASPVHSAETVSGPTPQHQHPPSAPRRRRPRTLVAVVAASLAVGVLGAFGLRALQDDPPPPAAAEETPSPAAGTTVQAGLDPHGVDRSRYFPVDPSAKPKGWKPWTVRMEGRPWSCAMNREIVVCRTFHGTLEAISAADGSPRWKAPAPEPGGEPILSATRGWFLPGNGSNPVIHGDVVVTGEDDKIRGRSVDDGTVLWEQPLNMDGITQDVLLADGVAFFVTGQNGSALHAYDAVKGKPLWTRALSTYTGPSAGRRTFMPHGIAGDHVLAPTDGGFTGFDVRTGRPKPVVVPGGAECTEVWVGGGDVLCRSGGTADTRLVVFDAETLDVAGKGHPSLRDDVPLESLVMVGSARYALGDSGKNVTLTGLNGTSAGRPRTLGPISVLDGGGRSTPKSVVVGSTALLTDNESLYTLPLKGGERKKFNVRSAPGSSPPGGAGQSADGHVWDPELISLGGALFVAYHDGTVRSFDLPA